ncbi:MAG: glycine cleavage system aminomethyltransferase GcvT [Minwuia sp.]|uniref:glycine cleavage system aminomethyltransferase GcvT n=1 Tax=Minwuia sp. TaxID=2493630 RepID=UPI003A8479AC
MTGSSLTTPLNALHRELGARMVDFAGYDMPVQFEGIMAEHTHTRTKAGLFDVSHMGQAVLEGDGADEALEALVPSNMRELKPGRQRYTMLLNADGGIIDDLMVTRRENDLLLVVNAACKEGDIAHIRANLPAGVRLTTLDDRALLALQGPEAETALAALVPGVAGMKFMDAAGFDWDGTDLWVSRSGYTGEDGFEISVPTDRAEALARKLLADERVKPIGLGARDSLRLEAGLCLYGHDIDTTTSPVEAGLVWAMQKRRRENGGFPGAERILKELSDGPSRYRVGLMPEGRAPVREGAELADADGNPIGVVTSGGFGPTAGHPVAMGYVADGFQTPGTAIQAMQRGKALPMTVAELPFVQQTYKR